MLYSKTSGKGDAWLAVMVLLALFLFASLACIPARAHDGLEQAEALPVFVEPVEIMYTCIPGDLMYWVMNGHARGTHVMGLKESAGAGWVLYIVNKCTSA